MGLFSILAEWGGKFELSLYGICIFIILLSVALIYDSDKKKYHTLVRSHKKKLYVIIIISFLCIPSYYIYDNGFFDRPTPPENQLVVAIAPFYNVDKNSNEFYDINILDDFIENIDNLGIKTIVLKDSHINNIEDAQFYGQKEGAHLIIYGKTSKTTIDTKYTGKIEYNILPLPIIENLVSNLSFLDYNGDENLELNCKVEYLITKDQKITITKYMANNASSTIAFIAAFDKYIKSDYISAIRFFKSTKNYEIDSNIFFYIANCYLSNNNLNESLEYFNKTLEINSQYAEALYSKGVILNNLDKPQ